MRWGWRTAAGLGMLVGVVSGVAAQTQRVGIYFDVDAQSCVAEISNYGPDVRAHVFAFMPEGTEVNGALFSLEMPPGYLIRRTLVPHNGHADGSLTSSTGLNVTLQTCPVAAAAVPVLLISFDFYQSDPSLPGGARTPNVQFNFGGGSVQADSLNLEKPHVKICAEDPINGEPEYVEVQVQVATLNCDAECPCVTAVSAATWTGMKFLYRER